MTICNKHELADFLGVSEKTLTDWQGKGLPFTAALKKGEPNTYDTVAVLGWLDEYRGGSTADLTKERALLARAQRQKTQIEINKLEGKLIDADTVHTVWADMVMSFRARILGAPTKLAPLLLGMDQHTIHSTITKELHDALRAMADYDPEQYARENK